jgi:hypothetical protein
MSKTQKCFLATGLLLIALAALFPPTVSRQGLSDNFVLRVFLYGDIDRKPCIYLEKLVAEWMFLAAMTSFFMVLHKPIGKICTRWIYEVRHAMDIEKTKEGCKGDSGFPPPSEQG